MVRLTLARTNSKSRFLQGHGTFSQAEWGCDARGLLRGRLAHGATDPQPESPEAHRSGSYPDRSDVEIGAALSRLAHNELEAYGTHGGQRTSEDDIRAILRTCRVLMTRIGVDFILPFSDYGTFRSHWVANGAHGSWQARRDILNAPSSRCISSWHALKTTAGVVIDRYVKVAVAHRAALALGLGTTAAMDAPADSPGGSCRPS